MVNKTFSVPWIGVMHFLFILVCHLTKAQFINMEPGSDNSLLVVRRVNDSITFKCSLKNGTGDTSLLSSIFFCRKHDQCHRTNSLFQGTSLTLQINHLQVPDSGNYFCNYNGTIQYPRRNLIVGHLPVPPSNVSCVSYDLYNMSCTWILKDINNVQDLVESWTIMYQRFDVDNGFRNANCIENESKVVSCEWSHDGFIPFLRYNISVSVKNAIGEATQYFTVDPMDKAKPSPVTNLSAKSTSDTIILTWDISEHLYIYLGDMHLQYNVSYWSENNNHHGSQVFETNRSSQNVTLGNLQPFTWYTLDVASRVNNPSGHWSDGARLKIRTKETVPSEAPITINGGYYYTEDMLLIFTKEMPIEKKNSERVEYEIHMSTFTNISVISTHSPSPTINVDLPTSVLPLNGYVELYAKNLIGIFKRPRKLYLTTEKMSDISVWTEYNKSSDTTEISYSDHGQHLSLPIKIIYFWCKRKGSSEMPICESDVNWIERNGSNSETIQIPRNNEWLYGVSVIYRDLVSDGLHFSNCDFRPTSYDINPKIESDVWKSESKVILKFNFDVCKDLPAQPLWFLVYYGEAETMRNITCGEGQSLSVINITWTVGMNSIPVTDLDLQRKYGFCVLIVLKYGQYIDTNTIFLLHTKDNGQNADGTLFVLVVIAVSVSCILIMTFILVRSWKFKASWQRKYPVVLPDISRKYSQNECLIGRNQRDLNSGSSGSSDPYTPLQVQRSKTFRYNKLQKKVSDTETDEHEDLSAYELDSDSGLSAPSTPVSSDVPTEDNRTAICPGNDHIVSESFGYVPHEEMVHQGKRKDDDTAMRSKLNSNKSVISDKHLHLMQKCSTSTSSLSLLDDINENLNSKNKTSDLSQDEVTSYVRGTIYSQTDQDQEDPTNNKIQENCNGKRFDYVHIPERNPQTAEVGSQQSLNISEKLQPDKVLNTDTIDTFMNEQKVYVSHRSIHSDINHDKIKNNMEYILF